jgi:hypothetical protein
MELLVISSCTDKKAVKPTNRLALDDFRDQDRLKMREMELARLSRPAIDMYRGQQHIELLKGLRLLREGFSQSVTSLKIISAGYGLIDENRIICPYDATFKGMPKYALHGWANHLSIPDDVRAATTWAPLVIFLLGDEYLQSIEPPVRSLHGQRFIFLLKPLLASAVNCAGTTVVEAGLEQGQFLGYKRMVALKGYMFHLFCKGVYRGRNVAFKKLLADDTPNTFMELVADGAST